MIFLTTITVEIEAADRREAEKHADMVGRFVVTQPCVCAVSVEPVGLLDNPHPPAMDLDTNPNTNPGGAS